MARERDPGHPLMSTASWTAAVRAMEHERPDRLLDDPWADALAGAVGRSWLGQRSDLPAIQVIAIRARFFDDFLQRVVNHEDIRQVVLPAVGFDTRAFRLPWPAGTRIFEIDHPQLLERKDQVLRAAGARATSVRTTIGEDLAGPWVEALVDAGFDPGAPSGWLLEGFLFYLSLEEVTRIVDQVSELAVSGSRLGFDIVSQATLTHPLTRPWIEMQTDMGAPWLGTMDDPAGFLAARDWTASVVQLGQPGADYGRWPYPVPPAELTDAPHNWFVTARKR
jgi:methyltransferase (TIGR00027 family)